ncbi:MULTISPECIES: HutD/Ves family protein [Rhizobium/Agrobacterium group]|uniref:HutD family protein n=4 Tax=Rhizobium/Agrobacterium group TaxID=227290 RepID=A8VZW4_RHIRH|nr:MULTISPECIES: HutD family protein [Rhizobium/Agrobacterium group]ABW33579.1 rcorf22 [Rhizobium rhizogenes]AQS65514.1 HutD family protein [Rhizobium rhizogenes]ASK42062.1 hypothetical protein [Rhizobium rhizogenes]MCZ7445905.1 HutD family protein [Rhizobium rhizogenes]MCZ7472669.1 HutD family protein [Rhizobium rhizogenes]
MRVLRSAQYKRTMWKNGKGETVEIAVSPPDASVDDFDWRISTATVALDGPFSTFDEVDRTLSVLTGEGIELAIAGEPATVCSQNSPPFTFRADVPTTARLVDGPISDLNVMSRRGRFGHRVARCRLDGELEVGSDVAVVFVIVMSGCALKNSGERLESLDALHLDRAEKVVLRANGPTTAFVVELLPL